jgi:predicted lipoprotein
MVKEIAMQWNGQGKGVADAIMTRVLAALLIGLAASAPAVAAGPQTESELLAVLADRAIEPGLARAAAASQELAASARNLCERRNDEALQQSRIAWKQAYLAWRTAQPMMLHGKAFKAEQLLEHWPANEAVLNGAVASKSLAHLLDNPDVRGFAGAECLLFAPADVAEATAQGRCDHLQSVVAEIADQAAANQLQWRREAPAFVAAGDGKPYLLPGDALSLVFARMLNVAERLLRDRLCAPSGFFEGAAKADLLEAWRSDASRQSFAASIDGLRRLLVGKGEGGVVDLVAVKDGLISKKNPRLAEDVRKQLDRIDEQLAGLKDGNMLRKDLQQDDKVLQPLYKSVEQLQKLIVEASLSLEVDVRGPGESQM